MLQNVLSDYRAIFYQHWYESLLVEPKWVCHGVVLLGVTYFPYTSNMAFRTSEDQEELVHKSEAADLNFAFGLTGADVGGLDLSDYTIFVPTDEAFESIGSVFDRADLATLQDILRYNIIENNVILPSLSNGTL